MAVRYMQKCACVITFRVYFKKDFYFNFVYVYALVHEYIATGGHERVVVSEQFLLLIAWPSLHP